MSKVRLIDANALKEKLKPCEEGACEHTCEDCRFRVVTAEDIDNAPTVTPEITSGDLISRESARMCLTGIIKDDMTISDFICRTDKRLREIPACEERPQPEITDEDIQNAIKQGYNDGYAMAKAKYERPKGKWVNKRFDCYLKEHGQCSNCLQRARVGNFCRNCGADMRGEKK